METVFLTHFLACVNTGLGFKVGSLVCFILLLVMPQLSEETAAFQGCCVLTLIKNCGNAVGSIFV